MTPLFIPLKTKFFEAFNNGSKTTEYRLYGPRWNERTCPVGRPVVLSKGYSKAHRLSGVITAFQTDATPTLIPGFRKCYPQGIRVRPASPYDVRSPARKVFFMIPTSKGFRFFALRHVV
jgi:hypothetical protein